MTGIVITVLNTWFTGFDDWDSDYCAEHLDQHDATFLNRMMLHSHLTPLMISRMIHCPVDLLLTPG